MLTQQTVATFRRPVWNNLVSRAEGLKFMAQAVSRRPFSAEAVIQSQASPCVFCGVRCDTGTGFSPVPLFPLSVSFHQCPTFINSFIAEAI